MEKDRRAKSKEIILEQKTWASLSDKETEAPRKEASMEETM